MSDELLADHIIALEDEATALKAALEECKALLEQNTVVMQAGTARIAALEAALQDANAAYDHGFRAGTAMRADRIEALEEALQRIAQWSEAYPRDIFPEPDWKKAAELLKAGGITLDRISGSCMRHVVEGVGEIARAALAPEPDK